MKKYQLEVARYNNYKNELQTVAKKEIEANDQNEAFEKACKLAGNKELTWFADFFLVENGQRVATVRKGF